MKTRHQTQVNSCNSIYLYRTAHLLIWTLHFSFSKIVVQNRSNGMVLTTLKNKTLFWFQHWIYFSFGILNQGIAWPSIWFSLFSKQKIVFFLFSLFFGHIQKSKQIRQPRHYFVFIIHSFVWRFQKAFKFFFFKF